MLKQVYLKAITPPMAVLDPFKGMTNFKIYVPMESVDAYKNETHWKKYADAIEGYEF
jgi:hypothetical protein